MDVSLVPDLMDCDPKEDSAGPMTLATEAVNHNSPQANNCKETNSTTEVAETPEDTTENISKAAYEHEQRQINAQIRIEELLGLLQEKDRKIEQLKQEPIQSTSAYEDRIKILETDIDDLKTQNTELQTKLETAKSINFKPRHVADPSKVTDDDIIRIWDKIRYNIAIMASNILTECPSKKDLNDTMNYTSCDLIQMIRRDIWNLEDEDNRSFMVERYLWLAVIENVSKQNGGGEFGKSWAGTVGQSLGLIINELACTVENSTMSLSKLIHWKSEGGKMIDELLGIDKEELQRLIGDMVNLFSHFLPRDKNDNLKGVDKLEKGLQKVLHDAVQLQAIFMSSKAQFDVDWLVRPSRGRDVYYRPESMESEGHEKEPLDRGSIVLFHLSPSLVKQGTADGDSYDQSIRLTKARVICD
ncbi:hypothetical protein K4K57_006607 [Colletotrichum sp. SAR 10_99]|nr:hypothetical protein K4K57_006607 [Colletotrichum sp. SAR 10_99]